MTVARDEQVFREALIQSSPNLRDKQIFREALIPTTNVLTPTLPVLPQIVCFPFHESPRFNTIIRTPQSHRGEIRIPTFQPTPWEFSWDISYIPGDAEQVNSQWRTLLNFYMQIQGSAGYFLFFHPWRHQATNVAIGTGNGVTTGFSLGISYISGGALELVQQLATTPQIFVNGVQQSIFSYNINKYGTLTFLTAPPSGATISWTGGFFYMCTMDDDSWKQLQEDYFQLWSLQPLKMKSAYY